MATLDRTQAPPFQLSKDYSLATPEAINLSGNKTLFVFRNLQQEAVKLELIFKAGKWYEPKLGVSHFTSQMLPKGTLKKNAFQIAEGLDSLGAQLEINPGFDAVSISLFSLRKNLLPALAIVSELLDTPSFDPDEFRLLKEIYIQGLRVNNEKTSVVATKEIRKAVFGNQHPYGSSLEEADVAQLAQSDLQEFFNRNFVLHSAFLIGRLSDLELKQVVMALVVSSGKTANDRSYERRTGLSQTITKPGSVQVSIRMGKKCHAKSDQPGYFDSVMFNHMLGGFFGSRLMKNIREEKGLTYGIYSHMNHFLRDDFWMIGAEVNQKNVNEAVLQIRNEIKLLQTEPIQQDELDIARNYFIGSWQSENSTLFSVADKVKSLYLWGLPVDYYSRFLDHIASITPRQIQESGQRHFGVADLLEVQVG
jgi:zinc protease